MPMVWIEPTVFLEHEGEYVYHSYKSGNFDDRSHLHYQVLSDVSDTAYAGFDIREVAYVVADRFEAPHDGSQEEHHRAVLRGAIKIAHAAGLTLEEWLRQESKRRKDDDLWYESEEP